MFCPNTSALDTDLNNAHLKVSSIYFIGANFLESMQIGYIGSTEGVIAVIFISTRSG